MILICTGGRDYEDWQKVYRVLHNALKIHGDWLQVFVGDARGADQIVRKGCEELGIKTTVFNAQWDKHGNPAGPIRNQVMVDAAIHIAPKGKVAGVAFPGGTGTAHCRDYMKKHNIKVHEVKDEREAG